MRLPTDRDHSEILSEYKYLVVIWSRTRARADAQQQRVCDASQRSRPTRSSLSPTPRPGDAELRVRVIATDRDVFNTCVRSLRVSDVVFIVVGRMPSGQKARGNAPTGILYGVIARHFVFGSVGSSCVCSLQGIGNLIHC